MNSILINPMFGIALSILIFYFCKQLSAITNSVFLNPLLLTIVLIIFILTALDIPFNAYNEGGRIINLFLAPATTVLAYSIYHQIKLLKQYIIPIIAGCFVGSLTSIFSAFLLCRLFGLNEILIASVLPKSVTTPIAIEISNQIGGISSITVAVVIVTGILGSMLCPILIKLFHLKNPVANGVAIGTCSHAVGTSKAIELGEVEGAMSGIAIGVSGILTVLIAMFL